MALRALRKLNLNGLVIEPGQFIPPTVQWKGSSLRACINTGRIEQIPDELLAARVQGGEGGDEVKTESPSSLNCPHCDKILNSKRGLTLHLKTHA